MFYKLKSISKKITPNERKYFYGFLSLSILAIISLAVLTFTKVTHAVPIQGGTYIEGVVGQPTFINPVISGNNDVDRDLITLTFCSLNDIAEKVSPEDDKTWKVRIKEEAKWHDGEKLTSDDVIFTINKIQDPEYKSPLNSSWQGVGTERVSEREILFTLPSSFSFFEDNTKKLFVIPKHIYNDIPLSNWRLSDYNLQPIGCGPYKFESFKKKTDGFITKYNFIANDNYIKGAPLIQNFEVNFYTDPNQAIEDFILARIDGLGGLSKDQIDQIKRTKSLEALPTPRYFAAFFNQSSHPALKNKNLRLALDTAIDRNLLIRETLGGYAIPVLGPITPNFLDNSLFNTKENEDHLKKANDILENSGWIYDEEIGNSVRVSQRDSDIRLEFDLLVPETDILIKTAKELESTWSQIGVKINTIVLSPETINNEILKERNYQILLFGNILGANPDLFSFWHSSQKFSPGLNLSLYENKTADKLIESIRSSFDKIEQESNLISLQTLIMGDIPAVFLNSPNYLYITTTELKGFNDKLIITPSNRFDDVEKWYLRTARKFITEEK